MIKRSLVAAAIAASLAVPFDSAQALTANANFNVTATLANFCTVSAATVRRRDEPGKLRHPDL